MVGQVNINQYSNIQAIYHLEDVNDSSGNGKTLTNNGTVTFTPFKFGNGADLGTSNATKSLSTTDRLNITGGACTFMFWARMRTEIPGSGAYLLFEQNDKTTNFVKFDLYYYDNAGTPSIRADRVKLNSATDSTSIYPKTLGVILPHHFALTYDGATVIVYLDGSPIARGASSGNGVSGTGNDGFYIGSDSVGSQLSSAIYDEFIVTSSTLTPRQIKDYYAWSTGKRTEVA